MTLLDLYESTQITGSTKYLYINEDICLIRRTEDDMVEFLYAQSPTNCGPMVFGKFPKNMSLELFKILYF